MVIVEATIYSGTMKSTKTTLYYFEGYETDAIFNVTNWLTFVCNERNKSGAPHDRVESVRLIGTAFDVESMLQSRGLEIKR